MMQTPEDPFRGLRGSDRSRLRKFGPIVLPADSALAAAGVSWYGIDGGDDFSAEIHFPGGANRGRYRSVLTSRAPADVASGAGEEEALRNFADQHLANEKLRVGGGGDPGQAILLSKSSSEIPVGSVLDAVTLGIDGVDVPGRGLAVSDFLFVSARVGSAIVRIAGDRAFARERFITYPAPA